jgi:transcriptional regulator with XRE-family HTH domain
LVARKSIKLDADRGYLPELGSVIREVRSEVGLSQEALADAAGMDRSHMSQVERGKRNLSILSLNQIAKALGKRPSELLAAVGL